MAEQYCHLMLPAGAPTKMSVAVEEAVASVAALITDFENGEVYVCTVG